MTETLTPAYTNMPPSQSVNPMKSASFLPFLALLFVGSGCAALIYEIVWLQLLQLHIGASAISLGVLLGTFMGGMCLGSLLLPKFISSKFHPLRVYATLELGIGIVGLLELLLVPAISGLYVHLASPGWFSVILRAIFAGICLLPPTILMGATLPAIARYVEATPRGVSWLGFFYGGNIIGAVFGCVLAGFYLLPNHDMSTVSYIAAAINGSVALLGFLLSLLTEHDSPEIKAAPARPIPLTPARLSIFVSIGLSGLTALGTEVVWTRLLSLMIGATVYTFSLILAVFLFGLGIGSTVGSMVARSSESPRAALAWCQFLLAVAIAWAAYAIAFSLPFWPINPALTAAQPWYQLQLDLARCCWVVLPGAILWGMSFPLALAAVASRGQDPGKLVGGVYAANTVGAILGALSFSMFFIPNLGTQGAHMLLILLAAISALIALAPMLSAAASEGASHPSGAATFGVAGGMVAIIIIAFALAINVSPPNWGAVAFGRNSATWLQELYPANNLTPEEILLLKQVNAYGLKLTLVDGKPKPATPPSDDVQRWIATNSDQLVTVLRKGAAMRPGFADEDPSSRAYGNGFPSRFCTYVGEGMNVSVAVTIDSNGYRYFHGAGKVQASSDPADMRLQRTLGHITALMRTDVKDVDVLVVACGAGVTAGSYVPYDNVRSITICDIEPMVPYNVSKKYFSEQNHGVIDDKRTKVHFDDGRHFVETTKQKFDIITSDPIDPWVKGCAALNTIEYYEMCKAHLKPGGAMALWIPLYESSEDTSKSVIATFFKVFPKSGILWSNDQNGKGYDAVLFGRAEDKPSEINLDAIQDFIDSHPKVQSSLRDVRFGMTHDANGMGSEAVEICSTFAVAAPDLAPWSKDAEDRELINYDRNLRLQYVAGRWINLDKQEEIFNHILQYYKFPDKTFAASSTERIGQLRRNLNATGRNER